VKVRELKRLVIDQDNDAFLRVQQSGKFADRRSGTLVCAGIGASLPRKESPWAAAKREVAGTAIAPAASPRN
jgi:hypothetical protein